MTLLADGSAAYPDDEGITTAIGSLWGAFADLPDWPEQTGPPPGDWTLPRLLVQAVLDIATGHIDLKELA